MARTKQTARRSTGRKAPSRVRKEAIWKAAGAAKKQAAKKQAEAADEDGDDGSESSLSSSQSSDAFSAVPAMVPNASFDRRGKNTVSDPFLVVDKGEDDDGDDDEDPVSTSAMRRQRRNLLALSPKLASTSNQALQGRLYEPAQADSAMTLDWEPNGKVDNSVPSSPTRSETPDDMGELVPLGRFSIFALAKTVPAIPLDSNGNWNAMDVFRSPPENRKTGMESAQALCDANNVHIAHLNATVVPLLGALLRDAVYTRFRYDMQLARRQRLEGEFVGQELEQNLMVNFTLFAAQKSVPYIRGELEEHGIRFAETDDSPALSTSVYQFQSEAAEQKAEFRVKQEEGFEMTHSPRDQSPAVTAESTDIGQELEPQTHGGNEAEQTAVIAPPSPVPAENVPGDDMQDSQMNNVSTEAPEEAPVLMEDTNDIDIDIDMKDTSESMSTTVIITGAQQDEHSALGDGRIEHTGTSETPHTVPVKLEETLFYSATSPQAPLTLVMKPEETLLDPTIPSHTPYTVAVKSEETLLHPAILPLARQDSVLSPSLPVEALHEAAPYQAAPSEVQQESTTASITEDQVQDFLEDTDSSSIEQARQYLTSAGGILRQAVRRFHRDQKAAVVAPKEAPPPVIKEPAPLTLLEQALITPAALRRERKSQGDVLIILDGVDLGRHCRVISSDLCEALPVLEAEPDVHLGDENLSEVHGVRRLYVLVRSMHGEMPKLKRVSLSTMREDCEDEVFTLSVLPEDTVNTAGTGTGKSAEQSHEQTESSRGNDDQMITEDESHQQEPHQQTGSDRQLKTAESTIDWQEGYEDFFCTLTPFKPEYFKAKDITTIMPKLEAVARIAHHYGAVKPDSLVTNSMTDLFNKFQLKHQLWEAVAQDAARWLMLALKLEHSLIFKEAFVHVVGNFPNWPWSVPISAFPIALQNSIEIKSSQLHEQRRSIDWKLMFLTISALQDPKDLASPLLPASPNSNPTAWITTNIWRDWISNHLAALEDPSDVRKFPTELCVHPEDAECLNVAGFYRRIEEGDGAYLPIGAVLSNWNEKRLNGNLHAESGWSKAVRADLATLKKAAKELVEPLARVNLQFRGRLDYLTCVEVKDEDLPWDKEAGADEDEVMG